MSRRHRRCALALILLAAAAVYAPNLPHPFQFDDEIKIIDNPAVQDPLSHFRAFRGEGYSEATTRLLPNLTFSLNYHLFGLNPTGYNATNLLFHLLNIWLVCRLGKTLLRRFGSKDPAVPLLGAALFSLHPLNTEAVNYCNARPNLMITTFYVTTLLCLLRAVKSQERPLKTRILRWTIFSATLLCTLLSKELGLTVTVMAPLILIWTGSKISRRQFLAGAAVLLGIGVGVTALTGALTFVRGILFPEQVLHEGKWTPYMFLNLLGQSEVMMKYLGLTLFPWPGFMNVDHEIKALYVRILFEKDAWGKAFLPALCAVPLAGLVATGFALRKRFPFAGFLLLWPFITHAPTSVVHRGEQMVEYRTYLPNVGLCLLLALGLIAAWRAASRRWGHAAALRYGGIGVLMTLLAAGTLARNAFWQTKVALWADAAKKSPGKARTQFNYASALGKAGRMEECAVSLRNTLRLDPHYDDGAAHGTLGAILANNGNIEEALAYFSEAIRLSSKDTKVACTARCNRGWAFVGQKKFDPAIADLSEAIRLDPRNTEAHNKLGFALCQTGRLEEAFRHISEAIRLDPRLTDAHFNMAKIYEKQGKREESIASLSQVLRLKPDHAEAHNNMGVILVTQGRAEEALSHVSEAVRLKPGYMEARNNLGILLETAGRLDEAAASFSEALKLNPGNAAALQGLERIRLRKGSKP